MNDPWNRWQPSKQQPWDLVRIAHLHRRAGFMPDWGTIQQGLSDGFEATMDRILHLELANTDPAFERLSSTIGEAASTSGNSDRLRAWWVYRMLATPRPLVERTTLLWHNHFATSNEKVQDVSAMFEQNQVFRQHGMGHFGDLLPAVVKQRAMLSWLDASANRKEHPNENLARELMELFTLGEGHYTEMDVKEAARCLTGWTIRGQRFAFIEEMHDPGEKSVLGHTGKMNGDDLLNLLLQQDATAKRISWRLCDLFFGEGVLDDPAREQFAIGLKQNRLDIAWGIETILRSQLFFSDANIRSRVMSPVEYIIGIIRSLEIARDPPSTLLLATALRQLGQDLFHPPNVFGWAEGRTWIHTRSVLARGRFVSNLLSGKLHASALGAIDLSTIAKKFGFGDSMQQVVEFIGLLVSNESNIGKRLVKSDGPLNSEGDLLRDIVADLLTEPKNLLG